MFIGQQEKREFLIGEFVKANFRLEAATQIADAVCVAIGKGGVDIQIEDVQLVEYFNELMRFAYSRNVFEGGFGIMILGAERREEVIERIKRLQKDITVKDNLDYPRPYAEIAKLLM